MERKDGLKPFENTLIAHRGLFDNESVAPENSMLAFQRAIDGNYGIELDVQLSKDGQLFVFHDDDLKRMAGADLRVTELTYEELLQYPLGKSDERIPLFEDVLNLVNGQIPMIIEIKVGADYKETTKAVAKMLESYHGIYCIECFNPMALAWYRKHVPEVIRGQLSMDYAYYIGKMPKLMKFLLTHMILNIFSRPDFISYNHKDVKKWGFRWYRNVLHRTTAAWTIRSQEELERNKSLFSIFIFDSFIPKNKN